jgi:hypothetical protein
MVSEGDEAERERGGKGKSSEEEHLNAVNPNPVDAMNFVTAEFYTPPFATSTERLPIVTDKFQNAMIAPLIDSGAWL